MSERRPTRDIKVGKLSMCPGGAIAVAAAGAITAGSVYGLTRAAFDDGSVRAQPDAEDDEGED
jgi:hypothetical protein